MKIKFICLLLYLMVSLGVYAEDDKGIIPPVQDSWNNNKADGDRSLSCAPSLFKDANYVYVYS